MDYRDALFLLGDTLKALYRVDQYEDMATLSNLLDEGLTAKETVVSILGTVSPEIQQERLLDFIEDVSTTLVRQWKDAFADLAYQFDEQILVPMLCWLSVFVWLFRNSKSNLPVPTLLKAVLLASLWITTWIISWVISNRPIAN